MNPNTIGSEWNRWDLHFHTPSSYDYGDKSVTNNEIIEGLKNAGVTAVAITDHHVIDLDRIAALRDIGRNHGISVLPGIEFLSDARGKEPIHFIAIFSETSNISHIWGQIENRTAIREVKGSGKRVNDVYCDLIDTISLVKELGGIISIHAGAKSGTVENITHALPHGAAQKADIAAVVDMYELGKASDADGYREFVFPSIGRQIPLIICSDNHNIRKYVIRDNLWIKSTCNFAGLQYALSEPEERFFIGVEPSSLIRMRENPTKYVREISIWCSGSDDPANKWFSDVRIPLNNELVTIIGNKGGGKSALADILAVCSDADHSEDYLFLHKNKFKKRGLADRFSASIKFASGVSTESRMLSHSVNESDQNKIRYLPQSYFEKVCNEIGKTEAFKIEIEKVVFQYITREKRLGKATFKELVDHKKTTITEQIALLKKQITELNAEIITLEDKSSNEYIANLTSRHKIKSDELLAHNLTKNPEQADPSLSTDDDHLLEQKKALSVWQKIRNELELSIEKIYRNLETNAILVANATQLHAEIEGKANEIKLFQELRRDKAAEFGLKINELIEITVNTSSVSDFIENIKKEILTLESELTVMADVGNISYDELPTKKSRFDRSAIEISKIQDKFSGEQRAYQEYLSTTRAWELRRAEIIGDLLSPGSIKFLEAELNYIKESLANDLLVRKRRRQDLSIKILRHHKEIKGFYDEIKLEIDSVFAEANVSGLKIASTLTKSVDFEDRFLGFIQQNKSSSFYGQDGKTILQNELLAQVDWNKEPDVNTFLTDILRYLETDQRSAGKLANTFAGNFVKNRLDFYNYVFSLNYIDSHYDLQQSGKSLEQLSPGEKGALLLIFYLVLDKEDIPLVIDQPEDNLDNYSVAKILVPYIKSAKRKRQIIIVTHNANLAVVADSEQVIKVDIDKNSGNLFRYISGGIEDGVINRAVVEVLEGTVTAFQNRRKKYQ